LECKLYTGREVSRLGIVNAGVLGEKNIQFQTATSREAPSFKGGWQRRVWCLMFGASLVLARLHRCGEALWAGMLEFGASDVSLLADNFDERAFPAAPVEFAVEDLFPRAEIEFAFGDGDQPISSVLCEFEEATERIH
jgi:hypothetical protein